MNRSGKWLARGGCAIALAATLFVAPASAARVARAKPAKPALVAGFSAFTPAAADPRLAAAFARSGLGTTNFNGGAFRFTPSAAAAKSRQITVAVRARAVTRAEAARNLLIASDIAPSAYSLGASVGWKRFAISGDIAKADGGLMPTGRESADVGLAYYGRRWATKLDLAADRASGDRPAALAGIDQSWSLGLGGTYALTHNLDVTGGVRYRAQREQFDSLLDDRRDSQSVYLGTTFHF